MSYSKRKLSVYPNEKETEKINFSTTLIRITKNARCKGKLFLSKI